jgi:hypothetical protein
MVSGITNSDSLPTVNVTINDFGLRIAPPSPGPKLTIIGGFKDTGGLIPMNEPLLIDNIGVAMRSLRNSDGSPSELTLAIEEAMGAGTNSIEVVVTDTSTATPFSGAVSGTYATDLYNALATTYSKLQHHEVDIVYVAGAYADGCFTGNATSTGGDLLGSTTSFVAQLGEFCYQQTKESNSAFGVIGVTPIGHVAKQLEWKDASATAVSDFTSTAGAWFMTPSLTLVNEYVKYLTHETGDFATYSGVAESYRGAPFASSAWNDYLKGSAVNTTDPALPDNSYIDLMRPNNTDGTPATDNDGNKVDAGAYISVIGGVARAFGAEAKRFAVAKGAGTVSYVNSNGAAAYAGMLTTTPSYIGVTNRSLPPLAQARSISGAQAKTLLQHRIVALLQKTGGYVITSGITGAFNAGVNSRSDYTRVTTIRTTQAMAEVVRDAGEAFIGKPISGPFLAALESAIDTNLQRALKRGAVRSYDFAISSTPDQQVLGEVTIDLSMVPAFELVTINTTISLAKGEGLG